MVLPFAGPGRNPVPHCRYMNPTQRPPKVPRSGFSLIELLVVMVIILIVVALSASLFQNTGASKLRSSSDQLVAMVEQARTAAITRRRPVMLAVREPAASGESEIQLGLFEFADLDEEADGNGHAVTQMRRWQRLPGGVVFLDGPADAPDAADLRNIADEEPVTIRWRDGQEGEAMHGIVFSPRGGMALPAGSDPMVFKIGLGTYQDGRPVLTGAKSTRSFRIGRVVARPWRLDG